MSRGRQRTLFSVGRRFPYAMARDLSPIEALACFHFGPTRKLTHAFALEAARRKIERRSCAGNAGGEAQTMQTYAESTQKGNVQPSHVSAAPHCQSSAMHRCAV